MEAIRAAVQEALESDAHMVVLNAGASAGSKDFTSHVINELGQVLVHGVTVMPGKPSILGQAQGKPVVATANGVVKYAARKQTLGLLVEIDHGGGIVTRYAHLGKILVEAGQQIARGQKIGTLGNSGRSTGPHLHYEVRSGERDLNPVRFLEAGAHAIEG